MRTLDTIAVVGTIIVLIVMICLLFLEQKDNGKKVFLPDGAGYYIKNAELTQEFFDSIPAGETLLVYGTITVSGSITGKGIDKTTIKAAE